MRRLHVRVDVDRLQKIQHPLRAPAHRVQQVVRVLRAKAAQQDRTLVRLQVAVRVLQKQHLGRIRHIETAIARHQRRRNVQPVRERRRFVRLAIAIRVLQHHHLVLRLFTGLDVRIRRTRDDPQPTLRVPVHLHRLLNHRLRRKQIHLEALRHHERLALRLRVRIWHISERSRLRSRDKNSAEGEKKTESGDHKKRAHDTTPRRPFGKHSLNEIKAISHPRLRNEFLRPSTSAATAPHQAG